MIYRGLTIFHEITANLSVSSSVVCVVVVAGAGDMKDAVKQDVADVKDESAAVEMKTDAKCESDNKEGVTKMDTIPASVAVTTSEPSAD